MHDHFEMEVSVPTEVVKAKLQENLLTHRGIFEKAIERFREEAVRRLQERIDDIKSGNSTATYVQLPVPEDHSADYERAIRMLTMHTATTITLPESTYRQFYEDDWAWKERWAGTNASYGLS